MTQPTTEPRTFTENETYALVADNVARETADLTAAKATLETEKAELQTQLDVAITARDAEKARADKAETDLVAFKATLETEKANAARADERVTKVRAAATHMGDEFFTAERAARWSAMDDEAFGSLVAELAAVATGAPAAAAPGVPRESAMTGQPPAAPSGNLARLFATRKLKEV